MKLPETVKIGSQVFTLSEREGNFDAGLSDTIAYTLPEVNLIVVRKDLPLQRKQAIVLHEIFHALIYTFTRLDRNEKNDNFDDWEHYFIGIVQEPMIMFLKDNPQFLKWLLQK